ncbi:MAG TPA: pitrilysin family protein [Steroidobacteraceae bacterium]|nr:pitrilysin family protein [Steroidobacteraceae bacterium]
MKPRPPRSTSSLLSVCAVLALGGCASTQSPAPATTQAPPPATPPAPPVPASSSALDIPVDYYRLPNGLRVVLSEDHSVPLATIGVYVNIGFRIEPRDRTGFAHLFEHMMFQGSANLGKMEFVRLIQANGGVLNGSTRFDFTNYFETVPAHTLEAMLWGEADRFRSLAINQDNLTNQINVVKNEVRVNVLNQPYGGFPWLDMPQYANENWYNAHNFYGELEHLEAAKLDEVLSFFDTYYGPENSVLVVVGDFDSAQTRGWIEKYFGNIPRRKAPPIPDIAEPPQTREKRATRTDALAPRPAMAIGYHVPQRWTPEHLAFGLIDYLLLQGADSALNRRLVQEKGYTDSVSGGINLLGNMFNYQGPMLWIASLTHDAQHTSDQILVDFDAEIARLQNERVSEAELERARTKYRSDLYDVLGQASRFGIVDLLASFALFDDDPALINKIEPRIAEVTPELIQQTARKYLRPENRTILRIEPGKTAKPAAAQEGKP